MLRAWQETCISKALSNYRLGKKHFLAQATPGAGKTLMAAHLAKQLLKRSKIDFVVCISPSKITSSNIQNTFEKVLSCPVDGSFGSLGQSITYQSLTHLNENFWAKLAKYKVLCVFDEIHHCGGDNEHNSNSWGYQLLYNVQQVSTYTLALTGTPWRSDNTPIALVSYSNPKGKIICDYQYTLYQAVKDRVCRSPKITLVDCKQSTLNVEGKKEVYPSIHRLIKDGEVSYSAILENKKAIHHLLQQAIEKLENIRNINPSAGGLIVASSVNHARLLAKILEVEFKQTTSIVTYQDNFAQNRIDKFKKSNTQWIVSVGMISEGADIPRLQVCCHLTNIKTELYFRQVLGRILRTTKDKNQEAWLYTFAEPNLIKFSEEIENDIPDSCMHLKDTTEILIPHSNNKTTLSSNVITNGKTTSSQSEFLWQNETKINSTAKLIESYHQDLVLSQFKQRVIEAFRYS
ncbi:DEAD/DEAH box helicase family protein [uncultured Photobacterium sp.]|uniref:DEAD/DEAH box helicase n=1 Tax=uncultured Photobacterium sp. TaxID=173973 RepID=UPI002625F1AC|nr:DEAD/DEAH box helicase family protein [uncultured Photobacterium sp.]